MMELNQTHDPALASWVSSANDGRTDFPIQNLPLAIFRRKGSAEDWRGGVAIGDQVLDLAAVAHSGGLSGVERAAVQAASGTTLNALMAMGNTAASALRAALSSALRSDAAQRAQWAAFLLPQSDAEYALPARVGDYTDFYVSVFHATNIGRLFRPDNPLMPNYNWIPIGYHGRASSVVVSDTDFRRPRGQTRAADGSAPVLRPSQRLDFELELGALMGRGNALGEPVLMDQAEQQLFGFVLLNDWSARDIQGWEYQPLGPFLGKNFATSVSPWVVTLEALAPFRTAAFQRAAGDPQPLPYLSSAVNRSHGGLDIQLEALLQTSGMRDRDQAPQRLALSNYKYAYWTAAQMITHHSINGCNLQPGDLLGTGTLSGPEPNQACAMIELTTGGKHPIALPGGEQRHWLEDGDTVILRGWCERPGAARIGFGQCRGTVLPAGTN